MNEMQINPNCLALKESSTLAVNTKVLKLRAQGKLVYHFAFGESPFPVPPDIVEELRRHADEKSYLPTARLYSLREAVAKHLNQEFQHHFNGENIFIGPGSKELLFQILFVLEGPVIILSPSWVSYRPQVELKKNNTKILATKKENNYKLSAKELERFCSHLGEGQKVLIINNPNNPTGHLYSGEEVKEISTVCRKHDVVIVSDEIYSQINFSGNSFVSFSQYAPERTIITGGLSKIFSAGGYRLGWMAIPNEMSVLYRPMLAMFSETFSAVSSPIQYAALAAYSNNNSVKDYVERCRLVYEVCAKYLYRRFIGMGLECTKPEGAFYLFLNFGPYKTKLKKRSLTTGKELTSFLLDQYSLAMLPGEDFYMPESSLSCRVAAVDFDGRKALEKVRLGDCLDESFVEKNCTNLKRACDVLESFLLSLNK